MKTIKKKKLCLLKEGWIWSLRAMQELFKMCMVKGFRYLRPRSLNQDALENTFASIRQFGSGNTNPSCYQFKAAIKTSILNNLISKTVKTKNCENDDCYILDNLNSFLDSKDEPQLIINDCVNQLSSIHLTLPKIDIFDSTFDLQAVTYVAGFVIK